MTAHISLRQELGALGFSEEEVTEFVNLLGRNLCGKATSDSLIELARFFGRINKSRGPEYVAHLMLEYSDHGGENAGLFTTVAKYKADPLIASVIRAFSEALPPGLG